MKRGAFIVFEGVDRCGKTTQTAKLLENLKSKSIPAELIRFPDRTTQTGKIIDSYLKSNVELEDHAIHLLFSANRWEAVSGIRKKLESGVTLVCDRYAYSGVCFSGSKPGMDFSWCKVSDNGLPAPDLVIFLDLPIEKAMQRGAFGEERYEKVEFQKLVREKFISLVSTPTWQVLDASQSIPELSRQIDKLASKVIQQTTQTGREIRTLWDSTEREGFM